MITCHSFDTDDLDSGPRVPCAWMGLVRTTPADSVHGGVEVGAGGGGHMGLRQLDVHPADGRR